MSDTTTLERARQSLDAHAWEQAYEGFASLDRDLSSEDLERLAEARGRDRLAVRRLDGARGLPAGALLGSPLEPEVGEAHDEMRGERVSIVHVRAAPRPSAAERVADLRPGVSPWELTWDVSA